MYNQSLGRWNVADPLSEIYFSYSGYQYVRNNPISRIDIMGMYDEEQVKKWEYESLMANGGYDSYTANLIVFGGQGNKGQNNNQQEDNNTVSGTGSFDIEPGGDVQDDKEKQFKNYDISLNEEIAFPGKIDVNGNIKYDIIDFKSSMKESPKEVLIQVLRAIRYSNFWGDDKFDVDEIFTCVDAACSTPFWSMGGTGQSFNNVTLNIDGVDVEFFRTEIPTKNVQQEIYAYPSRQSYSSPDAKKRIYSFNFFTISFDSKYEKIVNKYLLLD